MQINVAQLLKQPIGSTRSYKIDDIIHVAGEEPADYYVQGEIELVRTDRSILLRGTLGTKVNLACSRCLTSFEHPLVFKLEEEFFPTVNVTSGVSVPLPEDSTAFVIDEHHMLDLSEVVRQHALLTMPMKPLCRPKCAGLCPSCGANLNQGDCQCPPRSQKSPWAKLEKLCIS
jgi:uncharacterized protein